MRNCVKNVIKKTFLLFGLLIIASKLSPSILFVDGTSYCVDTIFNFSAGPGTQYVKLKLTASDRLDVHFLIVDASNPFVSFRTVLGRDSIYGGEKTSSMAIRKSKPEKSILQEPMVIFTI